MTLREQEQNDMSLRVFVSPNLKALAAFSVFGGLTLLFTVFTNVVLYFISLFMFCVLARELNSRCPSWRVTTIELLLFRILLLFLYFGVITYTSYAYFFSLGLLPLFLFLAFLYAFVGLILPRIKVSFSTKKHRP